MLLAVLAFGGLLIDRMLRHHSKSLAGTNYSAALDMKVQHGCHLSHLTGLWNAAALAMLLLYREIYFTCSNYSYRRVEHEKSFGLGSKAQTRKSQKF